ncbi:RadC family protein [Aquimarina sp. RZ0]|uniref:JAB domain-containing protein n=1 Tax=Aquimarina sp. RZ0 TaxID=2607730 RepID=UPI0011F22B09|nr:JAB domain-containing protein [Aquimarina sp. RZ0]KAA1244543.1 JAB domain-containing protein [Aquimarina sp. RZ0]
MKQSTAKRKGKSKNTNRVTLISKRAKQIRGKGEKWTNAIKRATLELKKEGALNGTAKTAKKKALTNNTSLYGVKGQFKPEIVPEIKLTYTRGRRLLGSAGSPDQIVDFVRKQFKKGTIETRENFYVIYLNHKNTILGYHLHSTGGLSGTVIDARIIFAIALKSLATQIILSHNHPGGGLKPSKQDIEQTTKIANNGKLHNIKVLDHLIITKDGYFSFAEENLAL